MKTPKAIAALIMLAMTPGFASAEVVENLSVTYYKVPVVSATLQNKKAVAQAIDMATPIKRLRDWHTISKTDTNLSWGLDMAGGRGECKIRSFRVELTANMQLPRLELQGVGDAAKIDAYNRYFEQHEQEHLKIARRAAHKINAAIANMKPMTNCSNMQEEINQMGRSITLAGKEEEHAFDLMVSKKPSRQ